MNEFDSTFEMSASRIRFGVGSTAEVGMDLADLGLRHVLVVADPVTERTGSLAVVKRSLESEQVDYEVFDRVHVEPSQRSFQDAINVATKGQFDGFVALGGGSTIDTAKVANLFSTYPAPFLTYVNAPLGQARPVPGPLKPLIAIPTTAGTGSETTGVAICDLTEQRIKSGIAHRFLKPMLGILDPNNTRTVPTMVAASAGLDVLCHALESYTAIPFQRRPKPARPAQRPNYQGANPISDVWVERATTMIVEFLPRVAANPDDDEARGQVMLAAAYAGIGFGNAGVHLPHAMSYPIASLVREYIAPDYPRDHALVPHGISVVITAPAVFRFTASENPQRHLRAAQLLGADVSHAKATDAGEILATRFAELLRHFAVPNGLDEVGYTAADLPALVQGTLLQERLTKISPRATSADDIRQLLADSMKLW